MNLHSGFKIKGDIDFNKFSPNNNIVIAASNSSARGKRNANYICDGVDDQVDIYTAVYSLGAVGGKVILLEGTFNLSSYLAIGYFGNLILEGQGDATVLNLNTVTDFCAIYNTGERSVLRNFKIVITNIAADGMAIYERNGGTDCIFENITIDGGNVAVSGIHQGTGYGIIRNITIKNCRISNIAPETWHDRGAIWLMNVTEHAIIEGNTINNVDNAIKLRGDKSIIVNNVIKTVSNIGIWLQPGVNLSDNKYVVLNNFIDSAKWGIHLDQTFCSIVKGNNIRNCLREGITLYRGDNNVVTDNYLLDNGQEIGFAQITLNDAVIQSIVSGNQIISTDGKANYGVYEQSNDDYNIYIGNYVKGHSAGQIHIEGINSIKEHNVELA